MEFAVLELVLLQDYVWVRGVSFKMQKKAQIWVETVIYTVIGLAIIGIVMAIATPAIAKYKDKIIIEQTFDGLNTLNDEIISIRNEGLGNKWPTKLSIKKGSLTVDGSGDYIIYVLDNTGVKYSEPDVKVKGDVNILTEKKGSKTYTITLSLEYDNIDLTYGGRDEIKKFTHSPTPYQIFIEHNGPSVTAPPKIQIDLSAS